MSEIVPDVRGGLTEMCDNRYNLQSDETLSERRSAEYNYFLTMGEHIHHFHRGRHSRYIRVT
jgi:hypothetical protein